VLIAMGCERQPPLKEITVLAKRPTARYYEFMKDGRYYVFESNKKATEFMLTGREPVMKALIGYGPGKTTVFVECAKDDSPMPAERLKKLFRYYHPEN